MYRATVRSGNTLVDQFFKSNEDDVVDTLYALYEGTDLEASVERMSLTNDIVETTKVFTIDIKPDVCV